MYQQNRYRAEVIRVIDGDTIEVRVDLGCYIEHKMTCRLLGIDAPEKRGATSEEGKAAQRHLTELLEKYKPLIVQTHKTDKYGRYLVDIYPESDLRINLNSLMVTDGFAVIREY